MLGYLLIIHLLLALLAAIHLLGSKEDERTAAAWLALVMLVPWLGPLLYFLFGINRIQRKARRLARRRRGHRNSVDNLHPNPFTACSSMQLLLGGKQAHPAMIQAIIEAKSEILLQSYIFNADQIGREFASALKDAQQRGVRVYVLLDDLGAFSVSHQMFRQLRRSGVQVIRFLPIFSRFWSAMNLRNHRKIMVVDEKLLFIGSMNITAEPMDDVQLRLEGDIVQDARRLFADDWEFAGGGKINWRQGNDNGRRMVRLVSAGPDQPQPHLLWLTLAAINRASSAIDIVTPYFLPPREILLGLELAARRGVRVRLLLPGKNDNGVIALAQEASIAQWQRLGIDVYLRRDPVFDHSKIFRIDQDYIRVGSSNWDQRSLALNFEADLEIVDAALCLPFIKLLHEKFAAASLLGRSWRTTRWRYALGRLVRIMSPYL